jgi:hypothetical protein
MEKEVECVKKERTPLPLLYLPFLQNMGLLLLEKAESNELVRSRPAVLVFLTSSSMPT